MFKREGVSNIPRSRGKAYDYDYDYDIRPSASAGVCESVRVEIVCVSVILIPSRLNVVVRNM